MYRTSEKTSLSRKMAELEDRWRKSQEDRYVLELKFKEVLKGLANKNEGNKLLKIRENYNRFLENEDARNERNDRILRVLDKIESQANMLSAKTERLKLLKLHYEAYMKRMYPSWEKEVNSEKIMLDKDHVYSSGHKNDQRNPVYSTLRVEVKHKNAHSSVQYSPRQSEKFHVSSNDFQPHLLNGQPAESLSNCNFGNVNARQSVSDNIGVQRLNREFSRVGMNTEEKSTSSRDPSFEQEENTSKDLLNVSLSDDNITNDATRPVDTSKPRKGKKDVDSHSNPRSTETEDVIVSPHKKNLQGNNGSDMFYNTENRVSVGNDNIHFLSEKIHSDIPSDHESRVVRGSASELQPSLVVTQSTPDIGKSSSEEDVSGKRIMMKDSKSKKCGYISSHETSGLTSEAEASEVEGIAGESGDDNRSNVKEILNAEQTPRPPSSFGNNQRNLEEPFQFSSSDADYDELENQMAALVEGKRNDKSQSKDLSQSEYESNENIGSGEAEHLLGNLHEKEISSDTAEDEMCLQKGESRSHHEQDLEGESGDVSSDNMENAPADTCLELVDQIGQNLQDSDTFSEKEEPFPAAELVEETDGGESFGADHGEVVSKGSIEHDEGVESTVVSTRQENDNQIGSMSGDGVEPQSGGLYCEEPEDVVENHSKEFYAQGDVYHDDVKSAENLENRDENGKLMEMDERHGSYYKNDRNIDFQDEQNNYSLHKKVEGVYAEDSIDQEGQMMQPQHEMQEESWVDEEKDEVGSMIHDSYRQPEEEEKMGAGGNNEYIRDQHEQTYGSGEIGDDNLEERMGETDDKSHDSYGAVDSHRVEGTDQEYTREEQEDQRYEGGEVEKREFENGKEREAKEEYDMGVTEEMKVLGSEENNSQEEMSGIGKYKHDEAETVVVESHVFPESQERDLLESDSERSQYDGETKVTEETNARKQEEEDERKVMEENYVRDSIQELEEPDKLQQHKKTEREDLSENVDVHFKTETNREPEVVKQDRSRQSPEQKGSQELNKERVVAGKMEKTGIGETRAVSQKTTRREEGQAGKLGKGREKESTRKDTEHSTSEKAERPAKEIPQVPSRPLSRQSTRKDGLGSDTYRGEKLKTAIRKFQAKKDTRLTTRRTVDSKK